MGVISYMQSPTLENERYCITYKVSPDLQLASGRKVGLLEQSSFCQPVSVLSHPTYLLVLPVKIEHGKSF